MILLFFKGGFCKFPDSPMSDPIHTCHSLMGLAIVKYLFYNFIISSPGKLNNVKAELSMTQNCFDKWRKITEKK